MPFPNFFEQAAVFLSGSATSILLLKGYRLFASVGGFLFNLLAIKEFMFKDIKRLMIVLLCLFFLVSTIGCTHSVRDDEIQIYDDKGTSLAIKKPSRSMGSVLTGQQYCSKELLEARTTRNTANIDMYESCRSKFVEKTIFINPFNIYRRIERKKSGE